ncbi:hypothetical protein BH20ACI1_BH20ACI1_18710 [soil metagenome]
MNFKNYLYSLFVTAFIVSLAGIAFPLNLHTYHTTLTRIDYNQKEKLAEISIQMFPHDLVPLLEKRAKKNIDLEKTSDIDSIILKYLSENFILKDKQGEIKKIVWVGKEIQADTIFVYIEIPLENDFDGFNLQNTLFFESFPEQVNLVITRINQRKADLVFKVGDKFKQIKTIKPS